MQFQIQIPAYFGFRWPGLAPAGDWLSCTRKKVSKEGVLRSLAPGNSLRARRALRSNSHGESDGRGHAGYRRCALMDALLLGGGFACCAASAVVQSLLIAATVGIY